MKKIFVYYSLTGNGDVVANYLMKKGYNIRKVDTSEELPKNYVLRIIAGGYKSMIGYEDKLIDFDSNIDSYDEVVIGSPVWNGNFSSPINTVLKELKLDNKKVKFILYSGSGTAKKVEDFINKKYGNVKIVNLKEPKNNMEELKKIKI